MEKVIVVVGPTGVGKTRMGVALAKHFNGEVISGDSMQIYKTMDIGTAKVTDDEMEGIVHQGINVERGVFGAMMEVSLINDGPVTIILDSNELFY